MTKIQLIDKCRNLSKELENTLYNADWQGMYSVDVKRHGSEGLDISELALLPEYREYSARILDYFTDEETSELYNLWLETEGMYFIDDFLSGCTLSGTPYYTKEVLPLIEAGKLTAWPSINNAKTKEYKIKLIKSWGRNDDKKLYMLSLLDVKSAGLYGRSGGHFCILPNAGLIHEQLEEVADNLEAGQTGYNDNYTVKDGLEEYRHLKEIAEAVLWVLQEAEKFNKGLKFEDELRFRIDEKIGEWMDEDKDTREIKTAGTLAKKHGYVLAQIIN